MMVLMGEIDFEKSLLLDILQLRRELVQRALGVMFLLVGVGGRGWSERERE
jgi:hypothetical protein